jgi:hypothetical protein
MLELVVLGASVAAFAVASGVDMRRRRFAMRALERYALRRGLRFGPGTKRTGPRVTAKKGDVELTIDFCRIRGELRTRVSAPTTTGRAPRVAIVQRAGAPAIAARSAQPPPAPREGFDELYRVLGMAPAEVPTLVVDCAAPLTVLARRSSVSLASDGSRVALTWRGLEDDLDLLDAALDAVAAAAAWHMPRAPYR